MAAIFLAADAHREGLDDLVEAFRRRALGAAVVTGALAVGGLGGDRVGRARTSTTGSPRASAWSW